MLEQSGLLNTTPVSGSQLAQLILVINGNCNCILETERISLQYITPLLNALANSEQQISSAAMNEFYESLPRKQAAKLLLAVFRAVQDENVSFVKITGWRGALWYASLVMWLNPGSVQVALKENMIFRSMNEKAEIRIVLRPPTDSFLPEWSVEEWSKVETLATLFKIPTSDKIEFPTNVSPSPGQQWRSGQNRVPRDMAYYLWQSVGGVSEEDLKLVAYITDRIVNSIIDPPSTKETQPGVSPRGPLFRQVLPKEFLFSPMDFLISFGFPIASADSYRTDGDNDFREFITSDAFRNNVDHMRRGTFWMLVDKIMEYLSHVRENQEKLRILPKRDYSRPPLSKTSAVKFKSEYHRRSIRICTLALHLSSTCFLDAVLSGDSPPRFLQLDNDFLRFNSEVFIEDTTTSTVYHDNDWTYKFNDDQGRWILKCIDSFEDFGCPNVNDFWDLCLRTLRIEDKGYPAGQVITNDSIIISVDGITIYPLCVLNHSSAQEEVLRLGVVNGNLHWNESRYDSLKELKVDWAPDWSFERHVSWVDLEDKANVALISNYDIQGQAKVFPSTVISAVGSEIISETCAYPEGSVGFIQSWRSALLGWARVPRASQLYWKLETQLEDSMRPLFARIVMPVDPSSRLAFESGQSREADCDHLANCIKHSVNDSKRLIVPKPSDSALDFLRMSFIFERNVPCVVNDIGDLAACAVLAEEEFGDRWLIITL